MTASRVYAARIAGLAIYDPNGDQVGRARDVVVRARQSAKPPRVLGLVAEMPVRRRIFLPMGRVVSIDTDAVALGTGTISLRRFERRTGEILVVEDLIDRQVTIVDSGVTATVVDVAMDADRAGVWSLSRVAVREQTGRLSRRGQLHQLDWDEISGLLGAPEVQGTASLLAMLEDMRPADLANVLQDMSDSRRNEVAAALDDERLADVLGELPEHDQVDILAALDRDRAADVLEEMDPDDAADLLAELPKRDQDELLGLMEPGEAVTGTGPAGLPARHSGQPDDLETGGTHPGLHSGRSTGPGAGAPTASGGGRPGVRRPGAYGHADRPLPRRRAFPAIAPRAPGGHARVYCRQRHRSAPPGDSIG